MRLHISQDVFSHIAWQDKEAISKDIEENKISLINKYGKEVPCKFDAIGCSTLAILWPSEGDDKMGKIFISIENGMINIYGISEDMVPSDLLTRDPSESQENTVVDDCTDLL